MNILFIGDVSGRPGREVVAKVLPNLRQQHKIDLVLANAENSAGGRGITKKIINELQSYGIDYFTLGEHAWDQKDFADELLEDTSLPVIRALNYEAEEQLPGVGYKIIDLGNVSVIVLCMLGQVFMKQDVRSPFWKFDEWWDNTIQNNNNLQLDSSIFVLDFHAEATSEKIALAWYLRDRISAFVGTHTHVATCDTRILEDKCAYVSDVGMCGPYEASLWVDFDSVMNNFRFPIKKKFEMQDEGGRIFNSVLITFDKSKPISIQRIDKICF
jgi:2',3'-cyclic-nucleotide 2'-phosphodiesterase